MIKPQNSSSSDSKSKSILLSMEQNAGWLALFSYFITVWTFFIEQNNWTWRIAGLLISAVATILVFTRAIDYNGDGADVDENGAPDPVREDNYVMNGIFRFAYGFILLIGCVLIYLSISDKPLLFGSNELSAKDKTAAAVELTKPVPQQSQHTTTVAKTTTQAGLTEITTVHTDVKRNSDTAEQKPASKADESSIEDLLNTRLSSVVAIV
ncbi:MAG: hypothetical protein ACI8YD_003456, partial [Rheinheimera aquimaris]